MPPPMTSVVVPAASRSSAARTGGQAEGLQHRGVAGGEDVQRVCGLQLVGAPRRHDEHVTRGQIERLAAEHDRAGSVEHRADAGTGLPLGSGGRAGDAPPHLAAHRRHDVAVAAGVPVTESSASGASSTSSRASSAASVSCPAVDQQRGMRRQIDARADPGRDRHRHPADRRSAADRRDASPICLFRVGGRLEEDRVERRDHRQVEHVQPHHRYSPGLWCSWKVHDGVRTRSPRLIAIGSPFTSVYTPSAVEDEPQRCGVCRCAGAASPGCRNCTAAHRVAGDERVRRRGRGCHRQDPAVAAPVDRHELTRPA